MRIFISLALTSLLLTSIDVPEANAMIEIDQEILRRSLPPDIQKTIDEVQRNVDRMVEQVVADFKKKADQITADFDRKASKEVNQFEQKVEQIEKNFKRDTKNMDELMESLGFKISEALLTPSETGTFPANSKPFLLAGGMSTGGGFIFKLQPTADAFPFDMFSFLIKGGEIETSQPSNSTRLEIRPSAFSEKFLADRLELKGTPLYAYVKERLDAWRKTSPKVVGLLEQAFDNLPWMYTPYRFKKTSAELQTAVPTEITNQWPNFKVALAILYQLGKGALISVPEWNPAPAVTQGLLLIHESARHIQITYHGAYKENEKWLDEKNLMNLSAKVMLSNPKNGETLDDPAFFSGTLKTMIQVQTKNLPVSTDNPYYDQIVRNYKARLDQFNAQIHLADTLTTPLGAEMADQMLRDYMDRKMSRYSKETRDSVDAYVNAFEKEKAVLFSEGYLER